MPNRKKQRKKAASRKPTKASRGKAKRVSKAKSPTSLARSRKRKAAAQRLRGRPAPGESVSYEPRGPGAASAGQSGDLQGITAVSDADSESAQDLLEEGQSFEAGVIDGVENAPEPDQGEVRTREVEEDDVPEEYRQTEP